MDRKPFRAPNERAERKLRPGISTEQEKQAEAALFTQLQIIGDNLNSFERMIAIEKGGLAKNDQEKWNELKPQLVIKISQEQSLGWALFQQLASLRENPSEDPELKRALFLIENGINIITEAANTLGLFPAATHH